MSNSPVAAIAPRSGNHMAGTITEPDVTDPIAASSAIASFAPLTTPKIVDVWDQYRGSRGHSGSDMGRIPIRNVRAFSGCVSANITASAMSSGSIMPSSIGSSSVRPVPMANSV